MEIYPFWKLSWRSREIQERWAPLRGRIYDAAAFAEYEMVKRGFRDANVYQLDPGRFDVQIDKVLRDGLGYRPILRSKQYKGYGHRHYPTDVIDKDTFIYGVVGKTQKHADRFWKANQGGVDHTTIGRMLGYPDCDIEFFNSVWLKEGNLDPMYEVALNTEGADIDGDVVTVSGHPYLNRLIRYFGFNLIPHFAHSFDCKEAVKFAETWLSLMREYDKEASEACIKALNQPMVWSLNNCITYVEHPLFIGAANGYDTPRKKTVKWLPSA